MASAAPRLDSVLRGRHGGVYVLGVFVAALLVPTLTDNAFYLSTVITALEFVALAVMFDLVVGRVGALSLAQPLFFGFGTYMAALLGTNGTTNLFLQALPTMAAAALLALVVGIPSFRLSLHSFAIGTLAFGEIGLLLATNWISVTRGPLCIVGVPPVSLGGAAGALGSLTGQLYLALGIAAAAAAAILLLEGLGLRLPVTGVREDPVLAASRGVWVTGTRLAVFVASAAGTALVGVFDAQFQSVVCPANLSFSYMVPLLFMVFVGGRASLRGVVLAAVIFTFLPQVLRIADEWRLAAFGLLLLLVVTAFPDGLERLLERAERPERRRRSDPPVQRQPSPAARVGRPDQ